MCKQDMYTAVKSVPIMQPLSMPGSAVNGSQTDLSIGRTASRRSQLISGYDKTSKRQSLRVMLGGQSQENLRAGMTSPTPSHGTSMSGVSAFYNARICKLTHPEADVLW